jgi:GxxExxY protein
MLEDPFGTNPLTSAIIGCGIRVHAWIGPGVFENVYCECLDYELRDQGFHVELQRAVPIVYRGVPLKSRYYVDMIVDNTVVVEVKTVAALAEIHRQQVITQLKLTGLPVGLLMNFNVVKMTDGVKRVVNPNYVEKQTQR